MAVAKGGSIPATAVEIGAYGYGFCLCDAGKRPPGGQGDIGKARGCGGETAACLFVSVARTDIDKAVDSDGVAAFHAAHGESDPTVKPLLERIAA